MGYNSKIIFCALLPILFTISIGADVKYVVKPSYYKIEIITTENNFKDTDDSDFDPTFTGSVAVEFTMNKPEQETVKDVDIILNTNADMKLHGCVLRGKRKEGEEISWKDIETEAKLDKDKLIVNAPEIGPYKEFELIVYYSNPFSKDLTGLYRSSYTDSSNKLRWLLTTHFEPIAARKAFPCFDYPDLKAEFEIDFYVPKSKNVLCNTPTTSEDNGENLVLYKCKKTLPMSTYLVAFTISDFIGTKSVDFDSNYPPEGPRKLTTYGRKEIIERGDADFAQKIGKAAVLELSKYLDWGYAFDKVDQVGIPDFSAGAMENWGHISFREKLLFFNDKITSSHTKQSIVQTITHELVHQWFGNLVTLQSWDYIWLNEGFARYLEYAISAKLSDTKGWELMKQFVVNEVHSRAFEIDGLNSSKSLNEKILDESLITPSFNDIPYAKGATILRMWENALGSEKFQKSLQKYLKARALQAARPVDLYEHFKNEAGMKKEFFETWTDQAGYPLVDVKKNKDGTYTLTQKRFFWDNSAKSDFKFYIPITYNSDKLNNWDTAPKEWLYNEPLTVTIPGKWIIINNKQTGYYRVNYDQENWNALTEALAKNLKDIDEINRAQIINDVYSLAKSLQGSYVNYQTALHLTKYLKNEKSFYPWKSALNAFNFLRVKLRNGPLLENFDEYVLDLIKPHFKKIETKATNHIEKFRDIEFARWACSLGHEPCLKEAKELFSSSKYSSLPDVQEIVLCAAVRHMNAFDKVFDKYVKEQDSGLKTMYINALGCTNDAAKAQEFLEKTLPEDGDIRTQDRIFVLSAVHNGNLKHIDLTFKFVEKNFKTIAKLYGGMDPLGGALVGIARKLNSQSEYERLKKLGEKIEVDEDGKAARDSLKNALNIARSNNEWISQRMMQFRQYFNAGSFVTYSLGLMSLCLVVVFQF